MSFLFSQPAPGVLPANSVDFTEVETIGPLTLLGNKLPGPNPSTIQELEVSDVATMLNLSQYTVGAASSIANSIPLFSDNTGKTLVDNSGWVIVGSVLRTLANGNGKVGSNTTRVGEGWFKDVLNLDTLAVSQILASDASKNIVSLDTATYPSLSELAYVKGVTSAIQSQLNAKVDSVSGSAPIVSSGGVTPTISINDFGGADGVLAGSKGAVPAPAATDNTKFLRGDGLWAAAGVNTAGALDQQVLAYDSGTGLPTWQYAGLGDGNLGTGNVVVGRTKPTWTGLNSVLVGTTALANGGDTELVSIGTGASAGSYSIAVGHNASAQATGTGNGQCVAIGKSANCSGPDSVSIGYIAVTNSSGVAIGRDATVTNTGGGIAIGRNAGTSATGFGTHGIAIGYLAKAGSGNSTIVIGHQAGNQGATSTGPANTILGSASATSLSSGNNNVVVGQNSAIAMTSGSENVCVGYTAATTNTRTGVTTGSQNVFVGSRSGFANTPSGTATVAVGYAAGSETDAVAIGALAYAGQTSIAIGRSAYTGLNSASVAIGYGSLASVGIGNNGGSQTTTLGAYTGGGTLTSGLGLLTRCVYLGAYAGSWSGGKTDEFMLDNQNRGSYANTQSQSLMYGTFNATPASQTLTINATTTSTYGFIGNNNGGDYDSYIKGLADDNLLYIDAGNDRVGIGTAAPTTKLDVNGDVKCGTVSFAADANRQATITNLGFLTNTKTHDFGSLSHGAEEETTITVTGASVGDACFVGAPATAELGLSWDAYVSAADTVTLRVYNYQNSGSIDPASATWRVTVLKT